jgi:hypothetical protein
MKRWGQLDAKLGSVQRQGCRAAGFGTNLGKYFKAIEQRNKSLGNSGSEMSWCLEEL